MIYVVCSVVLEKSGKFLFVKEEKDEAAGKFGLPGGRLDMGETIMESAIRELKEETGYEASNLRLQTINHKPHTQFGHSVVKFVYRGKIGKRIGVAELETAWLTLADVKDLQPKDLIRGQDVIDILEQTTVLDFDIRSY